jgi:hypothetical protein
MTESVDLTASSKKAPVASLMPTLAPVWALGVDQQPPMPLLPMQLKTMSIWFDVSDSTISKVRYFPSDAFSCEL